MNCFFKTAILFCSIGIKGVFAQADAEIKGMDIKVSQDAVTFLQFAGNIPNFDWDEKESYNIRKRGKDAIIITVIGEAVANSRLFISEGGRNHTFILSYQKEYDPNSFPLEHDFRSIDKLKTLSKQFSLTSTENKEPEEKAEEPPQKSKKELEAEKKQKQELQKQLDADADEILESNYKKSIQKADAAFELKDFGMARSSYYEALAIRPNENYPKKQIQKIIDQEKKADPTTLDVEPAYLDALKRGREALELKSYYSAKLAFMQASSLKPDEAYPKQMLNEVESAITLSTNEALKQKEEAEKQKQVDESYKQAITAGEKHQAAKKYDLAKEQFLIAAGLKPGEKLPGEKVTAIEKIEKDILEEQQQKALIVQQQKTDQQYQTLVAAGDKATEQNNFKEALKLYDEAIELKPGDNIAKNKKQQSENKQREAEKKAILTDLAKKEALERETQYKDLVKKADELFAKKDYDKAAESYFLILQVKANDPYATAQIKAIEKTLLDKERTLAEEAQKKVLNEYASAVSEGDAALVKGEYAKAKTAYVRALKAMPDKTHPKKQIFLIEKMQQEALTKEAETAKLELDKKIGNSIETGDQAFQQKDYTAARIAYQKALQYDPANSYAKKQIALINRPKALEEIERKEKQEQYKELIKKADAAFATANYTEAEKYYSSAKTLLPSEKHPANQLTKIDEQKQATILAKKREQTKLSYDRLVVEADKLFAAKKVDAAAKTYREAQAIWPEDTHAKQRLDAINELKQAELAKQVEKQLNEEKYEKAIKSAEQALAEEQWEMAVMGYDEALKAKPGDATAKTKKLIADKKLLALKEENEKKLRLKNQGLPLQTIHTPYTQPQFFKKYGSMSIFPPGQRTTAEYFLVPDTTKNGIAAREVRNRPLTDPILITDSIPKKAITLESIHFEGPGTFFVINIKNYDNAKDFIMGNLAISWYKKDGKALFLYPSYVDAFSVIGPENQYKLIFSAHTVNASDKDLFIIELADRVSNHKFELSFSGELYNSFFK